MKSGLLTGANMKVITTGPHRGFEPAGPDHMIWA